MLHGGMCVCVDGGYTAECVLRVEKGERTLASMRDTSDRSSCEKTSGSWSKSPLLMRLKMS